MIFSELLKSPVLIMCCNKWLVVSEAMPNMPLPDKIKVNHLAISKSLYFWYRLQGLMLQGIHWICQAMLISTMNKLQRISPRLLESAYQHFLTHVGRESHTLPTNTPLRGETHLPCSYETVIHSLQRLNLYIRNIYKRHHLLCALLLLPSARV
jgi:hypothetical protein